MKLVLFFQFKSLKEDFQYLLEKDIGDFHF